MTSDTNLYGLALYSLSFSDYNGNLRGFPPLILIEKGELYFYALCHLHFRLQGQAIRDPGHGDHPHPAGRTLVPFEGEADVYVVNTCSVTAVSDKKCRNMIRRRPPGPRRRWWRSAAATPRPSPTPSPPWGWIWWPGPVTGWPFLDRLEQWASGVRRRRRCRWDDALQRHDFELLPRRRAGRADPGHAQGGGRLQQLCTYCIIPFTRGPVRSESIPAAAVRPTPWPRRATTRS